MSDKEMDVLEIARLVQKALEEEMRKSFKALDAWKNAGCPPFPLIVEVEPQDQSAGTEGGENDKPRNDKLRQAIFRLSELSDSLVNVLNPLDRWADTQGEFQAGLLLGIHLCRQTLITMDRTLNYAQQQAAEQKPVPVTGQAIYTAVIERPSSNPENLTAPVVQHFFSEADAIAWLKTTMEQMHLDHWKEAEVATEWLRLANCIIYTTRNRFLRGHIFTGELA